MSSPDPWVDAGVSMFDVARAIDLLAKDAKRGTEHEGHDGWSFPHDRPGILYCGCGAVMAAADGGA